MIKRGASRGRSKGDASTDSGSPAAETPTKKESKSKDETELAKSLTKKKQRKMAEKEGSKVDTPTTRSRTKAAKDIDGEKKSVSKLTRYESKKEDLEGKNQAAVSEATADIEMRKPFVGSDLGGIRKHSSKPGHSTDKAFLACAPPLPDKFNRIPPISDLLKVAKQRAIDGLVHNMDPIALKVLNLLSSETENVTDEEDLRSDLSKENESMPMTKYSKDCSKQNLIPKAPKAKQQSSETEKEITEEKSLVNELTPMLPCSQDVDERNIIMDMKSSKVEDEFSLQNEMEHDSKTEGNECTPTLQCSKETDDGEMDMKSSKVQPKISSENEQKETEENECSSTIQFSKSDEDNKNVDLKSLRWQQDFSSENEKKETDSKLKENECIPIFQCCKDLVEQKLNLDLTASKVKNEFPLENEKEHESKTEGNECLPNLQCSKETDEEKVDPNMKPLKVQSEISSENEQKETEGNEGTPTMQLSKETDEEKLNMDLKSLRLQQDFSSEKEIDAKLRENETMPKLQCSKDLAEQKLNLDLEATKVEQELYSDVLKPVESKTNENKLTPFLQCSKDTAKQKLNLGLEESKGQEEVSSENEKESTEIKFDLPESFNKDVESKLLQCSEKIQNLDLRDSSSKQNVSSENLNTLNEPEIKESEEIIMVSRDVNLRFEFDTLGNKTVNVDDKFQYNADEKKKMTFIIGDRNVLLSFTDNKVWISTEKGEIDCSIRKSQVTFSLTDSTDSSPEVQSTTELPQSKDTEVIKDLGIATLTDTMERVSLNRSENPLHESGSETGNMSTVNTDSILVPRSAAQRRLQNITDTFLERFKDSCDNYEKDFLKHLKQRNEDTQKD